MKRFLNVFGSFLAIIGFFIAVIGSLHSHNFTMTTISNESPMFLDEVIEVEETPAEYIPPEVPVIRTGQFLNLTFEEMDELEAIAYAEARGEGVKGMALVMNVVINRSRKTGQSIHDVIYATGQFYTAGMTNDVSEECHEALALVMDGYDESQGALYFSAHGYSIYGEPLFKYGKHYFSK